MEKLYRLYDYPNNPPDSAWLACMNNLLLFSLYEREKGMVLENKDLLDRLVCNTWLALGDTRLFLTPRLANVQALLMSVSPIEVRHGLM